MRTMLKASGDVAKTNQAIRDGSLGKALQQVAEQIQPELTWFATDNGKRTAYYIFDLNDPSDIAAISEPLYFAFDATVEFMPIMSAEELQAGLERFARSQ